MDGAPSSRSAGSTKPPRGGLGGASPELERAALLFALLFLTAAVLIIGRTAREALFLTRFPVTWIAPMWLAYAVVSPIAAAGYASIIVRLPRVRFITLFTALAALTYAVLRVLIGLEVRAAYAVFWVWSDVIANFTAVAVWTLAQDLYDARSAKRVFGVLGIGQILGTVVCGFATGGIVHALGTENLLFVLIALLLAIAALAVLLARRSPPRASASRRADDPSQAPGRMPVWRSRYVGSIVVLIALLFIALTIGDYQFKAIVRTTYPDRDELARFFANFWGALGLVSLSVQLFITPRLLRRFGVLAGMLAMPAAFTASSLLLLGFPTLLCAAVLKGSDNGLQYTVHDPTTQLLLFPIPEAQRDRVRTLLSAIVKPVGCGLGALALMLLVPRAGAHGTGHALVLEASRLGLFTIPVGLAAIAVALLVRAGYVDAMRRTLMRREVAPDDLAPTPSALAFLEDALRSPSFPQVGFAVDRLRELDPERIRVALPDLARHPSARVRALSLELTTELDDPRGAELARAALEDEDPRVRVAAVRALGAILREDAHDELVRLADKHDDDDVQCAAIAGLLRDCGLDGMLDGAPRLRALLSSRDANERIAAARVLGMVGNTSLQRALGRLVADPDVAVRRAAIQAASAVHDARLMRRFLAALADRSLASFAAKAIVALGDAAVADLAGELASSSAPRAVRVAIPRILFRIGTPNALAALLERIGEPDDLVRQKVLASASRLRQALRAPAAPLRLVRGRIDREMEQHERERDGYLRVRSRVLRPLLEDAVMRRLRKSLVRVLRLCELAYPRDVVAGVRAHLFGSDADLRANALEVLESLLDRALRERLVALVERFLELRAGRFGEGATPSSAEIVRWVEDEIASGDPHRAALALDAVAYRSITAAGGVALAALAHDDPFAREAAAIAVAVTRPEGAEAALLRLVDDPDEVVANYARYVAETGKTGIGTEDFMYTTVEKVLFLQRIPVFARVAGDDLVTLARNSPVVSMRKGDVVFREGDAGGALYLIISGLVSLTVDHREVAHVEENEVFGEMSIFDREPRSATATVLEDVELLRVSAEDFHDAVRETVEIAEAVIQVLNRRLRESDRRLATARARLSVAMKVPRAPDAPRDEEKAPPPRDALVAADEDD
jgi:CRP-like cAMP-binding protein/HEAT repeat protein